jgi:hypothetical protein
MALHSPSHGRRAPIRVGPRKPPRSPWGCVQTLRDRAYEPGRRRPRGQGAPRVVHRRIHLTAFHSARCPLHFAVRASDRGDRMAGRSAAARLRSSALLLRGREVLRRWGSRGRRGAIERRGGATRASAAFRSVCRDPGQISRERETAAMSGTRRSLRTPGVSHLTTHSLAAARGRQRALFRLNPTARFSTNPAVEHPRRSVTTMTLPPLAQSVLLVAIASFTRDVQ